MFDGFLSFGGIELINAARTQAYLHNRLPSFPYARRTSLYDTIRIALGQDEYRSPYLDEADWVETESFDRVVRQNPSHDFYGLYPLSIEGISDSTMSAAVIEGVLDGGIVNSERDATRSIRVRGLLVGLDELSVEAGMTWLRNALRTNTCGMHGDGCGYQDLRYFLDKPEVCDPAWESIYNAGDSFPFGPLNPEITPVEFTHGLEGQPHSYEWELPVTDGVRIVWGARGFQEPEILEQYGPVYLRRSNYVPNPTFKNDTNNWTATAGTITRIDLTTNQYARVEQGTPRTYRTNWLPDPSFENGDPNDMGWRGSADVTAPVDGTAPQGTKVAVVPAQVGGNWIEASMLGPYDPTTGTLSFWKRHDDDITVTVTDGAGAEIFSHDFTGLADSWARVSVSAVPMLRDYVVRISTAGADEIRLDGFLLEAVGTMEAFFTGDTPDGGGVDYYFVDGSPVNASRGATGTDAAAAAETSVTDAPFGPAIVSFYARSVEATPTVAVDVVDDLANPLGNFNVQPGPEWTRYALGIPNGRKAQVKFESSDGYFEIDRVMVEPGTELNDFLDGDTMAPDGYVVSWTSAPHASISRMTWTGTTLIERRDNWRPFLQVLEGSVQSSELTYAFSGEVSMEMQLGNFDRTYHGVHCTVGPQVIRRYKLDSGAAWEIDFYLTATNPHAFSTFANLTTASFHDPDTIADYQVNLFTNPSAEATSGSVVVLTNLVTNPSAETGTTGWSSISGTTGVSAVTNPVSATDYGVRVARNTWSTASTAAGGGIAYGSLSGSAVTAGQTYSLYVGHIKSSINQRLRVQIEWQTSGGSFVSAVTGTEFQATAGTAYSKTLTGLLVPATAAWARIAVISVAGTGYANWSIASYLEVDGLNLINASDFPGGTFFYFDGSTTPGPEYSWAWTGTAHASTSTASSPSPVGWAAATSVAGSAVVGYQSHSFPYDRTAIFRTLILNPGSGAGIFTFGMNTTMANLPAVSALLTYTASAYVRTGRSTRLAVRFNWYTEAGALVSSEVVNGAPFVGDFSWRRLSGSATAPATATRLRVSVITEAGAGYVAFQGGDWIEVDAMMVTFGSNVYPYFDGATSDTEGYDYSWTGSADASTSTRTIHVETVDPLIDPDLPVVPTPPSPPAIPDLAIDETQVNWIRYHTAIPGGQIAGWAYTIPTLTLATGSQDVRQVRVRFFANPFGWAQEDLDPTAYCGEFLLSYLPANSSLTVSGVTESAWASVAGAAPVAANHLLYGTDGGPMEWPELTCGVEYIVTVDVPPTLDVDNLDIELALNRRE
jgi:hypothetical protein